MRNVHERYRHYLYLYGGYLRVLGRVSCDPPEGGQSAFEERFDNAIRTDGKSEIVSNQQAEKLVGLKTWVKNVVGKKGELPPERQ